MSCGDGIPTTLNEIISNLGHALLEVRTQALKSILFKLENGFVNKKQLAESQEIFIHLLEWFNHESVEMDDDALQLIKTLLQDSTSAVIRLLDVGGISFFQSFQNFASARNLVHIHEILAILSTTSGVPEQSVLGAHFPTQPYGFDSNQGISLCKDRAICAGNLNNIAELQLRSVSSQENAAVFGHVPSDSGHVPSDSTYEGGKTCDLGTLAAPLFNFPIIELEREDRQLFFELDVKLKMSDQQVIRSAVSAMRTVVLADFPPEILLQYPALFRSLLTLLQTSEPDSKLDDEVADLLSEWLAGLFRAAKVHCQKENFTTDKEDPSNLENTRKKLLDDSCQPLKMIRRQSYPSNHSPSVHSCLTVDDAAHQILGRAIPMLQDRFRISRSLRLIRRCLPLILRKSIGSEHEELLSFDKETSHQSTGIVDVGRVCGHLKAMSAVISFHGQERVLSDRLLICIIPIFAEILNLLPLLHCRSLLPTELQQFVFRAAMDPFLDTVYSSIRPRLEKNLTDLDPEASLILKDAHDVLCSVRFGQQLTTLAAGDMKSTAELDKFMCLLEQAIPSLSYKASGEMIAVMLNFAEKIVNFNYGSSNEGDMFFFTSRMTTAILRSLSCDSHEVQTIIYKDIARRLSNGLLKNAAVRFCNFFLLNKDVMLRMVTYGLSQEKTRQNVEIILESIIAGCDWDQIVAVFSVLLPVLCHYVESCNFVRSLMSRIENTLRLEDIILNRVRLLVHHDKPTRMQAASKLAEICQTQNCWRCSHPNFIVDPFSSIFDSMFAVLSCDIKIVSEQMHEVFDSREVLNLLSVFASQTLDWKIRVAAADQLLRLLEDDAKLFLLKKHGIIDIILSLVASDGEPGLVLSALKLLHNLVNCSSEARAVCMELRHLKVLLPFIFSDCIELRCRALFCLIHVAYDQELIRACKYRDDRALKEEIVVPCEAGECCRPGSINVPSFLEKYLLDNLPLRTYEISSAQKFSVQPRKEIISNFIEKILVSESLLHVQECAVTLVAEQKAFSKWLENEDSTLKRRQLFEVQSIVNVDRVLASMERTTTHSQFLSTLNQLEHLCTADEILAKAFFETEWWSKSLGRIMSTEPTSLADEEVVVAASTTLVKLIDSIPPGRCASGASLRFLSKCLKTNFSPFLEKKMSLASNGPLQTKFDVEVAILNLICAIIKHEQDNGAQIVAQDLLGNGVLVQLLGAHCISSALTGAIQEFIDDNRMLHVVLSCIRQLTLDVDWFRSWMVTDSRKRPTIDGFPFLDAIENLQNHHVCNLNALMPPLVEMIKQRYSMQHVKKTGFRGKFRIRESLAVLTQCLRDSCAAEYFFENFIKGCSISWIHELQRDVEVEVRAAGYALIAAMSIGFEVRSEIFAGNKSCTDDASDSFVVFLSPEYLEILELSLSCCLNTNEADLVRHQAMLHVVSVSAAFGKLAVEKQSYPPSPPKHRLSSAVDSLNKFEFVSNSVTFLSSSSLQTASSTSLFLYNLLCAELLLPMGGNGTSMLQPSVDADSTTILIGLVRIINVREIWRQISTLKTDQTPSQDFDSSWMMNEGFRFQSGQCFVSTVPTLLEGAAAACNYFRKLFQVCDSSMLSAKLCQLKIVDACMSLLNFDPNFLLKSESMCPFFPHWSLKTLSDCSNTSKLAALHLLLDLLNTEQAFEFAERITSFCSESGSTFIKSLGNLLNLRFPPEIHYATCHLFSLLLPLLKPGAIEVIGRYSEDSNDIHELTHRLIAYFNSLYLESDEMRTVSESELPVLVRRQTICTTISTVLGCSRTSQNFIKTCGFLEILVSTLRDRVAQLSLHHASGQLHGADGGQNEFASHRRAKPSFQHGLRRGFGPAEKGRDAHSQEINRTLMMLRNALFEAEEDVKKAVLDHGLLLTLNTLVNMPATRTIQFTFQLCLECLANFVNNSGVAQRVMVRPISGAPGQPHLLWRVAEQARRPALPIQQFNVCMSILSSCAACPDCLGSLVKLSVLSDAVRLLSDCTNLRDASRAVAILGLIVASTATEDGRNALLRSGGRPGSNGIPTDGILEAVIRTRAVFENVGAARHNCALILRNLAFQPEGKCHFLAVPGAFEVLLEDAEVGAPMIAENIYCRCYASNAIWSLLYNFQKTKAFLRSRRIIPRIQQLERSLRRDLDRQGDFEGVDVVNEDTNLWNECTVESDRQSLLRLAWDSARRAAALCSDDI